jgi:hypothetical protein
MRSEGALDGLYQPGVDGIIVVAGTVVHIQAG